MKLGILNIHNMSFNAPEVEPLVELIKKEELSIICFEESNRAVVKRLSGMLNGNYLFYGGLGVISMKKKPIEKAQIFLKRTRNALIFEHTENEKTYRIAVTHLDHEYEKRRLEEYKILEPHLGDVDILVGDLNAIHPPDYSKAHLTRINDERKRDSWELVRSDLIEAIKKKGFLVSEYLGPTCRFETRIDYILYRKGMKNHQYNLDCQTNGITDHNMIVGVFDQED